jgi:hypothetical protein
MQDTRALSNLRNLTSWRAWQGEAFQRSGFTAISVAMGLLVVGFTVAISLLKPSLTVLEVVSGLYLLTAGGLMVVAFVRLSAWKRAHPWTPPPERTR